MSSLPSSSKIPVGFGKIRENQKANLAEKRQLTFNQVRKKLKLSSSSASVSTSSVVRPKSIISVVSLGLSSSVSSPVSSSLRSVSFDDSKVKQYLSEAVRPSTATVYKRLWNKFLIFCSSAGFSSVPASSDSVAAFLIALAENSGGKSSSFTAAAAINYFHRLERSDLDSPTEAWVVKRVLKSIERKFSKPVKKAAVFDSDLMIDFVKFLLNQVSLPLNQFRLLALISLQFVIMGRFSCVQRLKVRDIKWLKSGDLEVTVNIAKNYETWEAETVLGAANPGGEVDVVEVVKRFG